ATQSRNDTTVSDKSLTVVCRLSTTERGKVKIVSGSLKRNNQNAVGWVSNPPKAPQTYRHCEPCNARRGNLLTTENGFELMNVNGKQIKSGDCHAVIS
ncbi:MAG: hypothetical protein IJR44_02135, partial [Neisseriaceae bacterium]|nr:hypothetical protein [Neisseriaceae bacterium]